MGDFHPALAHGKFEELFPGVFFVTGTHEAEFFGSDWQFSRNMTVVRDGDALTLVNSLRLDEEGLAALEALGTVKNVVKIGSMHGIDDAFYVDRYKATFWALPGMQHAGGLSAHKELKVDGEMPFSDCSLFAFETTKLPECVLRIDREGGIMVACDALQNWVAADEYMDESTVEKMGGAGFFKPANVGPAWMQVNEVKASDFARLKEIAFKHALCGHGVPLRDTAHQDYAATFKRLFDI